MLVRFTLVLRGIYSVQSVEVNRSFPRNQVKNLTRHTIASQLTRREPGAHSSKLQGEGPYCVLVVLGVT